MDGFMRALVSVWTDSGFAHLSIENVIMIGVGLVLLYLAIAKQYEPLLLLPIAFGDIMANFPNTGFEDEMGVMMAIGFGIKYEIFPPLIFMGVGAMTDFGPLIANPKTMLLGAAAQIGVFVALAGAMVLGFTAPQAAAIGIIGGADGPTALFVTAKSEDKAVLTTCSALHFAPPKKITWRIVFHETPFAPESFPLL